MAPNLPKRFLFRRFHAPISYPLHSATCSALRNQVFGSSLERPARRARVYFLGLALGLATFGFAGSLSQYGDLQPEQRTGFSPSLDCHS